MAIKTFKEVAVVTTIMVGLLSIVMYSFFGQILDILTDQEQIKEISFCMRGWVLMNMPLDCFTYMVRGALKALGLQKRIVLPHFLGQGILSCLLTFLFGFYLKLELNGIWLANTLVNFFLIGYYLVILRKLDWFEIVLEAHKKQTKKSDLISEFKDERLSNAYTTGESKNMLIKAKLQNEVLSKEVSEIEIFSDISIKDKPAVTPPDR